MSKDNLLQKIKDWCNKHESGDWILETMTDEDIIVRFNSLRAAKQFCELKHTHHKSISDFL